MSYNDSLHVSLELVLRQSLTVNIHCEFSSRFHSDSKRIRSGLIFESKRIAANSQRFRATVWLREFWSRCHSDSLRDSVMGWLGELSGLGVLASQ